MVEREPLEFERSLPRRRPQPLVPQHSAPDLVDRGPLREVRNDHHLLDRRDPPGDVGDAPEAVDLLSAVATPVGTEQDAWRDLAEAVHDARHAEVGRAGRPDGAEARGREHRDHRLGDVRHEPRHAISRPEACRAQRRRDPSRRGVERAVTQLAPRAGLIPCHERRVCVAPPQQVFGEVQARAREPAWPLHWVGRGHAVQPHSNLVPRLGSSVPLCRNHAAEAPHGRPEPLRRCDRPAVQRGIVGDVRPILPTHCCDEGGQVCAGHPVGRRRPEGGVVQSYFVTLGDAVTLRVMT